MSKTRPPGNGQSSGPGSPRGQLFHTRSQQNVRYRPIQDLPRPYPDAWRRRPDTKKATAMQWPYVSCLRDKVGGEETSKTLRASKTGRERTFFHALSDVRSAAPSRGTPGRPRRVNHSNLRTPPGADLPPAPSRRFGIGRFRTFRVHSRADGVAVRTRKKPLRCSGRTSAALGTRSVTGKLRKVSARRSRPGTDVRPTPVGSPLR